MKNYRITVNGTAYDVAVEDLSQAAPQTQAAPQAAPAPKAAPAPQAAPSPQAAAGSIEVSAPMPGKILGIKANVGQAVKTGDVVLILEAMKMENEVVAPSDGTVASINVAVGDSVEAGDILATMN